VVDAVGWHGLEANLVADATTELHIIVVSALQQAVRHECEGVGRASAIVAIEDFARASDRGFTETFVAFRLALQKPQIRAGIVVASADEVVPAHSHIPSVLVSQSANRNAKPYFFFDELGGQDFAEVSGSPLRGLRKLGSEDFGSDREPQPRNVIGNAVQPIIVRANRSG
jgi:hypothetical protein